MRLRDKLIFTTGIILAVVLLTAAGTRLDYINSQRVEMKLISNEPLENAPPSLAFATVAMGAFRGLVVDVLWMRAERLKEEGQFFDARQLAEWITVLQPRFAEVWEFQAWNMAYNISVAIPATEPDQRWQWVKNGYELLRDRGIPMNPKSILLYRELGRIFQHKIGSDSDDDHRYYKLQLALSMEPLLGPADNAWFEALAKAPAEWRQAANDPNISPFIAAIKAADKTFDDESQFIGNYLSLRQNRSRFEPAAFEVIDRFRGTKALTDFDVFAKAWQLRHVWKLDPEMMLELNKTYGPVDLEDPNKHYPLDWRHPDTHAIYWAVKGLRVAGNKKVKIEGRREEYPVSEENTDRIVSQSLQNLFMYGKIFIYDIQDNQVTRLGQAGVETGVGTAKEIFLRPDLRMFDSYEKAVTKIISKYVDPNDIDFQDSHETQKRNMLSNALYAFYQAGHKRKAQEIYDRLRKEYNRPEFSNPSVDVYVRQRLREDIKDISAVRADQMITTMLREAYFRYALRDDDESYGIEKLAEEIHDAYNKYFWDDPRKQLPDFNVMRYTAISDFFSDDLYPLVMRKNLLARIRIERPELAKRFSQIEKQFQQESQRSQQ